jgi:acetate kinase
METILVVNAGSSSFKFQVFTLGAVADLKCLIKAKIKAVSAAFLNDGLASSTIAKCRTTQAQ